MKVKLLKKLRKKAFEKYKMQYNGVSYYILNTLHSSLYIIEGGYYYDRKVALNSLTKLRRDYILGSLSEYSKYHTRVINKNRELLRYNRYGRLQEKV